LILVCRVGVIRSARYRLGNICGERVEELFVKQIFPSIWENIGKSKLDIARRKSDEMLREDAVKFALAHSWQTEFH